MLAPLAGLLGRWEGEGRGEYPTIESFDYREEVVFSHGGKPFLAYGQRTWSLEDGRPLHVEVGYLRALGGGLVEWVIAQPTGIAEIQSGRVEVGRLRLRSTSLARSATAKEVTELERDLDLDGDRLAYEVRMAAVGHPLALHLAATLHRVG